LDRPQAELWNRIRIHFGRLYPDPDPGGQEWPTNVKKIQVLKYWIFSFKNEDLSCSLDVLYGGIWKSKLHYFVIKTLDSDLHWPKMLNPFPDLN
jgi:hypothetical protein